VKIARFRSTRRRGRLIAGLVLVCSTLVSGVLTPAAQASEWSPPTRVWVESAGHTVDGLFLDMWRQNPGLMGMPISEEFEAKVPVDKDESKKLVVQYYENLAIAYSPGDDRGDEWTVHALPLGKETYENDQKLLRKMKLPEKGSCGDLVATECRRFAETGFTIRWGFKEYWETNGAEPIFGLPISEEFIGSDGWTTQYFERMVLLWKQDEGVKPRAIGKEIARTDKVSTTKIAQPEGIPLYDEALFIAPVESVGGSLGSGPGPIQGGWKEIVISVSQQSMWAYEGGELVISSLVSTGTGDVPETETPVGYFSVHLKYLTQTMEGTISNEYYNVPDVPWVMYFDYAGNAIHGAYWHNNFGQRMSHGCVNLPLDVAEFLWGWAPEGTAVTVIA
jgi:hypothetical protein